MTPSARAAHSHAERGDSDTTERVVEFAPFGLKGPADTADQHGDESSARGASRHDDRDVAARRPHGHQGATPSPVLARPDRRHIRRPQNRSTSAGSRVTRPRSNRGSGLGLGSHQDRIGERLGAALLGRSTWDGLYAAARWRPSGRSKPVTVSNATGASATIMLVSGEKPSLTRSA